MGTVAELASWITLPLALAVLLPLTCQPAGRIAAWREEFPAAEREGLKSRPRQPRSANSPRLNARSANSRWTSDVARALLADRAPRYRAKALSVAEGLDNASLARSAGWRGCRGRRRASDAAGAAPRSPLLVVSVRRTCHARPGGATA